MAAKREEIIQQLQVKLDMLTSRYDSMRQKLQLLDGLKEENALLKKNLETLKMAKTLAMSERDIHQAKVQLSRLIHQIDKCISLLIVEK